MPEKLAYTADEAAALLDISRPVFDALDAAGRIARIDYGVTPAGQPRRIRRYSLEALHAFVARPAAYDSASEEEPDAATTSRRPQAIRVQARAVAARRAARARKPRASSKGLPLRIVE